jgi:tetratricopeptide (TPR) repeat protein
MEKMKDDISSKYKPNTNFWATLIAQKSSSDMLCKEALLDVKTKCQNEISTLQEKYNKIFDDYLHLNLQIKIQNATKHKEQIDNSENFDKLIENLLTMSNSFYESKYYNVALDITKLVLESITEKYGDNHRLTTNLKIKIADLLVEMDILKDAKNIYKNIIEIMLENNEKDDKIILIMDKLASVQDKLELYTGAIINYKKILDIKINLYGETHETSLKTMQDLATVLFNAEKYVDALDIFQYIYEEQMQTLDECNVNIVTTLRNIANVLNNLNQVDEYIKTYENIIEIEKKCLGGDHLNTLSSMTFYSNILVNNELFNDAVKITDFVVEKCIERFGNEDINTLNAKENLALTLFQSGQEADAFDILSEILIHKSDLFGESHEEVLKTTQNINHLKY